MPFSHDIAGGQGNLIATSLQSPNFDAALGTGWQVASDGSATFYNVSIPGIQPGAKVTFSSTAPESPDTGDIWYDTAEGLLESQWDGSEWVPYSIGTGAISDSAITQELIADGAVGSSQIEAGTVVAGIVDSTTVNAATFTGSVFEGTAFEINADGAFFYAS